MSQFDRLLRSHLEPHLDRQYAVAVELTRMTQAVNGRPAADPAFPVRTLQGVFFYYPKAFGIELGVRKTYREANDFRATQSGRDPFVLFKADDFATQAEEPRKDDLIRFPDLYPDLIFQVYQSERDGLTRIVVSLVLEGGQQ